MNGRERIENALKGLENDRTPVMLHNFQMAAREAGFTMERYRESPKNIADTFIRAIETYDYDGVLVDIDTATLAGAAGVPVDFPEDEPARTHEPLLTELDNFDFLREVKVADYKYIQIWCEAVAILKDYFKNEIYIRGNCDQAPFSLASMLRPPQEWMMDLMMNEEKALELIDICAGLTIQFIETMTETGCHMVSNGDSPAGPEMISPDMYEKFALPYEKRVVEAAHDAGAAYTLHICGDTTVILDTITKTGADALELDYKTDVHKAREALDGKMTFIGNIDPSGVIALGTPDDVKRETEKLLAVFADTPRFILNAGCSIPPNTPSENLKALISAARC
jgi:uroporphyrinogen decarboxylase